MTSPGALIASVASSFGVPENVVAYPYRVLRENGLVSTGGRGRSAAKVTPSDAANLLIAVASNLPAKGTLETWREYATLPPNPTHSLLQIDHEYPDSMLEWDLRFMPIPAVKALPSQHNFCDALTALIEASVDGSLDKGIRARSDNWSVDDAPYVISVDLIGPIPRAHITIDPIFGNFLEMKAYDRVPHEPVARKQWAEKEFRESGDLEQKREFTARTIFALGDLLGQRG